MTAANSVVDGIQRGFVETHCAKQLSHGAFHVKIYGYINLKYGTRGSFLPELISLLLYYNYTSVKLTSVKLLAV